MSTTTPAVELAEFERLYRRWWPDVHSLCRRLLADDGEAEDAAQEAFLRAWAARERYSALMPFWPWLATIARRLCLDRRRRPGALPVRDPHLVTHAGPEQAMVTGEDLRAVAGVLEAMRPRERQVLLRRQLEGWSYQRIARSEGVTVESVRSSLKRSRALLRRSQFDEADDPESPPNGSTRLQRSRPCE